MNSKQKKETIKNLLKTKIYVNDILIYKLLENNLLDHLINKLDNKKINCNFNKKGYLTSEEQFLNLLDNFIIHLNNTFSMLEYTYLYMMIEEMLKSKHCKIFLSKHYWGNNTYLEKYQIEFDKIIAEPFLNNLLYLTKNYFTSTTDSIKIIITNKKDINISNLLVINNTINFLNKLLQNNPEHLHFTTMHLFINIENYITSIQNKKTNITNKEKKEIQESLLTFFNDTWTILYENYKKNTNNF